LVFIFLEQNGYKLATAPSGVTTFYKLNIGVKAKGQKAEPTKSSLFIKK
jgi:hypothetical protein